MDESQQNETSGSDHGKQSILECLREFDAQYQQVTSATNVLTSLLLDYISGIEVSRSDAVPRIVQAMNAVNSTKLEEMIEWLPQTFKNILQDMIKRLADCEQAVYKNMNKIADLKYSEIALQSVKISELEQIIENKDRIILSLKSSENVVLWEKEKKRILHDHERMIENLHSKLREMERQNEILRKKLSEQSDDLKLVKLKADLTRSRTIASLPEMSDLAQLEDLKKKTYLYEKDLQFGQQEVNRFQTNLLGMLGGIQGDLSTTFEKVKDQALVAKLKAICETLDTIKCGVAGTVDLQVIRAGLSEKYLPGLDLNFFVTAQGKKVTVKPIQLRRLSSTVIPQINGEKKPLYAPDDHNILNSLAPEECEKAQPKNPQLMNDRMLNLVAVMKHFPTLSSNYVKTHWENFKQYDKDCDGELDMSEIMNAVTQFLPKHVKADVIHAAMKEVDTDSSGTLDFYEYLQIAILLEKKKGKSALFHMPDVQNHNKQISKTCTVQ